MSLLMANKVHRYIWSLVFWWKFKYREYFGPYILWTWSLINVFYSTFTNGFCILVTLLRFLTFFILISTFFYMYDLVGLSIFTARCYALQSAVMPQYIVRLSVCQSVRPWRSGTVIT